MTKKSSLSVMSENVFPVIKKWLYSDHDISYKELISNGCDAITKLKKLELMGEYERPEDVEYEVQVAMSPTDKTIKITDNGLDMIEEEIDKYTSQITFSGVQGFMFKYKDKVNKDQIIGHFDLGFYSMFMMTDKVSIKPLSWQENTKVAHWESEGGIKFEMEEGDKVGVGTTITLYPNEDSAELCNKYRAREVIEKYCAFVPVNILLDNGMAEPQYEVIEKNELTDRDEVTETVTEPVKTGEKESEGGTKETAEIEPSRGGYKVLKRPVALNDTSLLWNKHPNGRSKEDYRGFCHEVFRNYKESLLQTHLDMDYPFNSRGILYFPKINMEYDSLEGTIKLYNSQVFTTDNMKEVIPKFPILLKGVIDRPDLSLDVSGSALQNDDFVRKISDYITKKVTDRLSGICKTGRENYEKYWDDIVPFIKLGHIEDEKFAEKMGDFILYRNLGGKYLTLQGCLDGSKKKHKNTMFCVTNGKEQSQYISMFKEEGIGAVIMPAATDNPFISHAEQKKEDLKLLRIDTDLNAAFKGEAKKDDEKFKKTPEELSELLKEALDNDKLNIEIGRMKSAGVASMITVSEDTHCTQDMMKICNMGGMDMGTFSRTGGTLVLNANHPSVQYMLNHKEGGSTGKTYEQLYDLTNSNHDALSPEHIAKFVSRSNKIMMIMAGEKVGQRNDSRAGTIVIEETLPGLVGRAVLFCFAPLF